VRLRVAILLALAAAALAAGAALRGRLRRSSERERLLGELAWGVIVPQYRALAERAGDLRRAASALARSPSEEARRAAREAWKAARLAWAACGPHFIGPERDRFLAAKMDTPAAPPAALEEARARACAVEALGAPLKGFGAIEFFLFADARLLEPGEGRRREFVEALAADLERTACAVRDFWEPSGGGFADRFARPGRGDSPYATADAALDEIINALVQFLERVKDERLGRPLGVLRTGTGEPRPELVRSRAGGHALAELRAEIEGVERLYEKLSPGVVRAAPELDASVRLALRKSRQDVAAIPEPLEEAVVRHPDAVLNAFNMLQVLRDRLAVHLVAAYRSSLRFGDFDGD
jgi:predicted lipoprotein